MTVCRAICLLAGGSLLLLPASAPGDQKSDAIARLLDVGWSITAQARTAADSQYDEVARVAAGDPRGLEAAWLVLMQQRRYDDALKRIDEYLTLRPDDIQALRAKTWIQTVLKNYPAAILSADKLSKLVAAHPPTTDEERTAHDDAIGFLGRLYGYFGGPVSDAINQDERRVIEKKLIERLDSSKRPIFEDARNGVLAKYIEMSDESAGARDKANAAARAEKEKTLAELQTDKDKTDARIKELEERKNKLNNEFKTEIDDINKQEQPIIQQQTVLASRANVLSNDLIGFESQVASLQQLASQEKNIVRQQQFLNQASALGLTCARIEANLLAANRLLANAQRQRAGLQAKRVQAQSNTASQVERIDREMADLEKRDRRNDVLEKRASRPTSVATSKLRALSAQATALSTYDAFPLEAVKAKLMESLK
jgi:hypothetical protein